MSIKLNLLSTWMPEFIIKMEMKNLGKATIGELDRLIQENTPISIQSDNEFMFRGSSASIRKEIALTHAKKVNLLVNALGSEKAIKLGREALFNLGEDLGVQLKNRLGVDESLKQLIKAARILYQVLGIDFEVKKINNEIFMKVNRCTLSKYYSPETCLILSAADEGVVKGLNPNITMKFKDRISEGAEYCLASIKLKKEENKI